MAVSDSVLVDSSVWIDFFRGVESAVAAISWLTKTKTVFICGQIKQEVLQGSRDAKAFEKLEMQMSLWEFQAETPVDFAEAARIFASLRWKAITIPPTNCLIAALAKRCDLPLFTFDPDFDSIPGIDRFRLP